MRLDGLASDQWLEAGCGVLGGGGSGGGAACQQRADRAPRDGDPLGDQLIVAVDRVDLPDARSRRPIEHLSITDSLKGPAGLILL